MVVDRLVLKPGVERRLTESVEIALNLADDIVVINTLDGGDRLFSRKLACTYCGVSMPEMTPRAFSFNSPHGACPECQGLGAVYDFDPLRLVPDDSLSLQAGRHRAVGKRGQETRPRGAWQSEQDIRDRPDGSVPPAVEEGARPALLRRPRQRPSRRGDPARKKTKGRAAADDPFGAGFEGLVPNLRRRYEEGTWLEQENLEPFSALRPCPTCDGERLKAQSRAVRVKGRTISEYVHLPVVGGGPGVRRAGAHRSRGTDRQPHPSRDPRSAALPR